MCPVSPKSELFETVARTGKALGSGKRLELLDLLAQTERSVQELAETADLNLTTASAHLQVLRDAGLVTSRREGTRIFYRLSGPDVAALVAALCQLAETYRPEARAVLSTFAVDDDVRVLSRAELLDASTTVTSSCWTCARARSSPPGTCAGRGRSLSTSWPGGARRSRWMPRWSPTAGAATACCPTPGRLAARQWETGGAERRGDPRVAGLRRPPRLSRDTEP
jgi:DNA-binding transcriptional ArsR family regulator